MKICSQEVKEYHLNCISSAIVRSPILQINVRSGPLEVPDSLVCAHDHYIFDASAALQLRLQWIWRCWFDSLACVARRTG